MAASKSVPNQERFMKCLLCAEGWGDTAVNKTDKSPCLEGADREAPSQENKRTSGCDQVCRGNHAEEGWGTARPRRRVLWPRGSGARKGWPSARPDPWVASHLQKRKLRPRDSRGKSVRLSPPTTGLGPQVRKRSQGHGAFSKSKHG